jgi:predicted glycogen debranching enzyme
VNEGIQVAKLDLDGLLEREWLVTNLLGSYSSSTTCGLNARRYHGLLVAAMTPPTRRMVLLSRVEETLHCDGRAFELACNEYPGTVWPRGHELLRAFSTEPHPRWAFQGDGWTLQKELRLLRDENTVLLSYTLLGGGNGVDLELRPLLALRGMHELCYQWNGKLVAEDRGHGAWRIPATRRTPEVFLAHDGNFDGKAHWYLNHIYRREAAYGYAGLEDLWSPGAAHVRIMPGQTVHLAASADPIELEQVVRKAERQTREPDVRLASSRTLIASVPEQARADEDLDALVKATAAYPLATANGESFGVVGRYHWSPPSVRAAVAGFAGLFLVPGRLNLGRSLLAVLAERLENGLLPAELRDTDTAPPATRPPDIALWYVNAVRQYLLYSGDEWTVRQHLLPAVMAIIDTIQRNGADGVHCDEHGLLSAGTPESAVTWMNTTVNGVPVNPRHGRAIEINALWFNALMSAADLCRRFDRPADASRCDGLASRMREAFNDRFWNVVEGCCFDVVGDGGVDSAIRPNQLLAISLPFAVLWPDRWAAVVEKARNELLTPWGVRTLSPRDHRYIGRYAGPQHDRDRAAHNGSAYPWLLGPLATAMVRLGGGSPASRAAARGLLVGCLVRLRGDGLGHLFELCDGNPPHAPGGPIASPLSVAEIARAYAEDVLGRTPRGNQHRSSIETGLPV